MSEALLRTHRSSDDERGGMDAATLAAYEDPAVVDGYIAANATTTALVERLHRFARSLPGVRVLDLGCGPGHHAWEFARLGYEATGLDISREMIRRARCLHPGRIPAPQFVIGDMLEVDSIFGDGSFDGVWAVASILHMHAGDTARVLNRVRHVLVPRGRLYVSTKEGAGAKTRTEKVYGPRISRRFVYWTATSLAEVVEAQGFHPIALEREDTSRGTWLGLWAERD